jgi:hypothetical protein
LASAVVAGLCLVALPLTGANGLGLVPALALWLGYAGVGAWRAAGPGARAAAVVAWVSVAAALALVALYFVSYEKVAGHEGHRSLGDVGETATRFLAMALGPVGTYAWPLPGMALLAAAVLAAVRLLRTAARRPPERRRALGLFCFLGALGSLALGFGWGRAAFMQSEEWVAQNTRYITLAAPLLCCFFFTGWLYAGRAVPAALAILMALFLVPNSRDGLAHARSRFDTMGRVRADVRAGLSPDELGKKYARAIYVETSPDGLARRFEMLRQAHQGPYKDLPRD